MKLRRVYRETKNGVTEIGTRSIFGKRVIYVYTYGVRWRMTIVPNHPKKKINYYPRYKVGI